MQNLPTNTPLTFEALMASIHESNRFLTEKFAETERFLKESTAETKGLFKETDRILKENAIKTDGMFKETERIQKEAARMIGGMSNSNGEVAESYFTNSFTNSMQFAGQEYDSITFNQGKKVKKLNLQDEYDLLLHNGNSVVIIEIKYKADKDDVAPLLRKAQTYKQLFPEYTHYSLYLGLAGLHIDAAAEKEAKKHGIAIIKQVGDTMVIHDVGLKVF